MRFKDKKIMVAGAGISGIAAAKLLETVGALITLYDGNAELNVSEIEEKMIKAGINDLSKISIVKGEIDEELIKSFDLCVISPGISLETSFVDVFKRNNINIIGEIELAYLCGRGKIVGITGTNGKTTTTALTGEIMKAYYESVFVVGNIGTPYTLMAEETKEESVIVAEISSFQLETINEFHPLVSAVLNITPDHLNRHHTMENYSMIKMSIGKNQSQDEIMVLNYEDELIRKYENTINSKKLYFSSVRELKDGIFMDEDKNIYLSIDSNKELLLNLNETKLVGDHNAENIMAAIGISISLNVPKEVYLRVIKNFNAIEHRIEFVRNYKDVIYYNDSKGTNTDASIKALLAMNRKTVLIAGGYDKNSEFDDWILAFNGKIKALILIGKTKDKIAETARKHGYNDIYIVNELEEAVKLSYELSKEGEAVLLSPACASWDMFKSYEERGDLFKKYVMEL